MNTQMGYIWSKLPTLISVRNSITKQHILEEIRRIAVANDGIPPGSQRFETETGIREAAWSGKYWARWGDALREAGYAPKSWQQPYSDDVLVKCYIQLIRELGHFPAVRELSLKRRRDPTFPSSGAFARFGKRSDAAKRIVNFCQKNNANEDVIAICEPVASEPVTAEEPALEPVEGFVYLIKSGRHYKIGRSNSTGRREYELAIQLPEKATKVHEIRTDDPAGIEVYWHNRFAEKRRGGEWFELTASDVHAFKRRKFM